jgi:hypothetical protein
MTKPVSDLYSNNYLLLTVKPDRKYGDVQGQHVLKGEFEEKLKMKSKAIKTIVEGSGRRQCSRSI